MKRHIKEYYCEKCGLESHVFYTDSECAMDKITEDHKFWSKECIDSKIIVFEEKEMHW